MSNPGRTESGLAKLLDRPDGSVTVVGTASLGAQRRTLLIDIADGDSVIPAVAQISHDVIGASTPVTAEAELVRLAFDAGVPAAEVLAASDDIGLVGGPVMVSRLVEGATIPRQILRSIAVDDESGDRLAADCGKALAALHSIDSDAMPSEVPRLDDERIGDDYLDQLLVLLDQLPERHPAIRLGLNWLRRNPVAGSPGERLVHGDFRNGNLIVNQNRLVAVLDWELAHVGDPMEDLAWLCLRTWRFGNDDRPVGGFGSLHALRDAYRSAGGDWDDERFQWWMAARSAWWALGLARQAAAFRAGFADSIVLAASGRRVVELEFDLLSLIDDRERD